MFWACSYRGVDWKGLGCNSANLKALCKHFGLPIPGHRAAGDVAALYRLLEQAMPDGKTALRHLAEGLVSPEE
jgi:DNA polymerase-3 subunit epsilon